MELFDLREPVSAGSHGAWLLMSLPATALLWRRVEGDRGKQVSFLVYGLTLAWCSAASTLLHGAHGTSEDLAFYALLDHIGIYLLIAGTYTPIAWNLLEGQWRWGMLVLAWVAAAGGAGLQLAWGTLPPAVYTTLYLAMGWGAVLSYSEISRTVAKRDLIPLALGGVFYSVGALINLFRWPVLWAGVFGFHELFHVLVVAASAAHFWFMLAVVVPFPRADVRVPLARTPWLPIRWATRSSTPWQAPHFLTAWRSQTEQGLLPLPYFARWKRNDRP